MGFTVAGGLGMFLGVLLLKSPLISSLMSLVDQAQPLQRLVVALVIFFVGMALSGVILGALGGWVLTLVDSLALQRRYILAGAAAFAVAQAIFVPLGLFLASLLGIYYNQIDADPAHLPILLGLFGLFYGMVVGIIFGLASVGFKYGWGVLFAAMMGGLLGGTFAGELLRLTLGRMGISELVARGWLIWLIIMVFYGVVGLALGLVFTWFHRARAYGGDLPRSMGRIWRLLAIFAIAILLMNLTGAFLQVFSFAMMKQGSTSTVLGPKAEGVAWTERLPLPYPVAAIEPPSLTIDRQNRLALAWTRYDEDGEKSASLSWGGVDANGWARWEATQFLDEKLSEQPAIAMDDAGNQHIVWVSLAQENAPRILYQLCHDGDCDPAIELTYLPSNCPMRGAPASPTIAIHDAGQIMVVWAYEDATLAYLTWQVGSPVPLRVDCLPIRGQRPRLAPAGKAAFLLAWEKDGDVRLARITSDSRSVQPLYQAPGQAPTPLFDAEEGKVHLAWCGEDRLPHYWTPEIGEEALAGPGCNGRVIPLRDQQGHLHLLWESYQAVNPFDFVHTGNFLYDSVRTAGQWGPPILMDAATQPLPFDAVADMKGGLHMAVMRGGGRYASRPRYTCPDSTGSPYGDAILHVLRTAPYRPSDAFIPFCGNQFLGLFLLPQPVPDTMPAEAVAVQTPANATAFDAIADQIRNARYEVLFATMEWMKDERMDSPGFQLAQAVTDLYYQVKAHPENYPRGMTVRILLGNYPVLATFTWGEQVWNVMDVLQKAGLPEMTNPELGWKVELANFDGQNPHSHAKFLIVDGEKVMAAGFNYSYLHFSRHNPSGLGVSLVDYGMLMRGPVAQDALAAYDDIWEGADLVQCPGLNPPKGRWDRYCTVAEGAAEAQHVPEVLLYHTTPGDEVAFSLLRTSHRPESDKALEALIRSAQRRIDIFHVNFSLEIYCALGIVMDDFCSMQDGLGYTQALLDVMEQKQVRIRVLTTDVNMNGIENSVAIEAFRKELARRGLLHLAEFRYYEGRMHAKALLVDDAFLVVGSQNFHYSAWGDGRGLVEYNLATNAEEAIAQFQDSFTYFWQHSKPVLPGEVRNE